MDSITEDDSQLFDKIFKLMLFLSNRAVISFINALFGTNHPLDSVVTYPNTEFVSTHFKRIQSDLLITINDTHHYHIDCQIRDRNLMVIRMFYYDFAEGERNSTIGEDKILTINFPEARVIYLESGPQSDSLNLRIKYPNGTSTLYTVPVFKVLEHTVKELEDRKLCLLLPFYALKLRRRIAEAKSGSRRQALFGELSAIRADLEAAVSRSVEAGILNRDDEQKVQDSLEKLFSHLYTKYTEYKGVESMVGSAQAEFDRGLDILERRIIADKIVEMAEVAQRKLRETEQELQEAKRQRQETEQKLAQEREESERQRQETEQKLAQEREESERQRQETEQRYKELERIVREAGLDPNSPTI
ncbi:hypothetical protein FACS1894200_01850 [Spirochaetia bacterium]|nr:hypothetical protein FACS1894200_01850 [Spirochaetia bacterium]